MVPSFLNGDHTDYFPGGVAPSSCIGMKSMSGIIFTLAPCIKRPTKVVLEWLNDADVQYLQNFSIQGVV
jgi:hypothetical protein